MSANSSPWAAGLFAEEARARCPRVWEAEPVSDGRLGAVERVSFESHTRGCVVCRRELLALSALDATTRGLATLQSTRFERQRLRGRLLRRANQELYRMNPRLVQARWLAALAVSLVVAVGAALSWIGG